MVTAPVLEQPRVLSPLAVLALLLPLGSATPKEDGKWVKASTAPQLFWGAATAAFQTEGAPEEDGKGPSIWDTFTSQPGKIANGDDARIAVDFYHRYPQDIKMMQELGIRHFRFSISWPRIYPKGKGEVNQKGIDFYSGLVDALLAAGIQPFVTLFHWDLPQALEDEYQGWLSEAIVADFTAYAHTMFQALGDRVTHWSTINEPWTVAMLGYGTGEHAPGRCSKPSCNGGNSSLEPFVASHNMLLAHAAAVEDFRRTLPHGKISINVNGDWAEPFDAASEADRAAAERRMLFQTGLYADPLYFGDYPEEVRRRVPGLPRFTPQQSAALKGSTDYYAFNHYSSDYVQSAPRQGPPSEAKLKSAWVWEETSVSYTNSKGESLGPSGESFWLQAAPWGFRKMLVWLTKRYNHPTIVVTENGCDIAGEHKMALPAVLEDTFRVDYFKGYLEAALQAIQEDGVDLQGYFAWSLLDNFEWARGYQERFGIVWVDYATLERHPKKSAAFLREFFAEHDGRPLVLDPKGARRGSIAQYNPMMGALAWMTGQRRG